MSASPAEIIHALLLELSGSVFTDPELDQDWPLHISNMPDGEGVPAKVGVVYDTTGDSLTRLLTSGREIERYGIQIRIRSTDYDVGLLKETADLLSAVIQYPITIDGTLYTIDNFKRTSPVLALPLDESNRWHFTVNGLLMMRDY